MSHLHNAGETLAAAEALQGMEAQKPSFAEPGIGHSYRHRHRRDQPQPQRQHRLHISYRSLVWVLLGCALLLGVVSWYVFGFAILSNLVDSGLQVSLPDLGAAQSVMTWVARSVAASVAASVAVSAAIFGLIGSLVLGCQMVIARKAAQDFVKAVRTELVSLAAKSQVHAQPELSGPFLSGLSADALWAHTQTSAGLTSVLSQLDESVPIGKVPPSSVGNLGALNAAVLSTSTRSNECIEAVLALLSRQSAVLEELQQALVRVDTLGREVNALRSTTGALRDEVKQQSVVIQRMDTTLWNSEKEGLCEAFSAPVGAASKPAPGARSSASPRAKI